MANSIPAAITHTANTNQRAALNVRKDSLTRKGQNTSAQKAPVPSTQTLAQSVMMAIWFRERANTDPFMDAATTLNANTSSGNIAGPRVAEIIFHDQLARAIFLVHFFCP